MSASACWPQYHRIDLSMREMVISLIMSTVVRLALTNSCMQDQGFLDCFRRHPG